MSATEEECGVQGGVRLSGGLDLNQNGILEENEEEFSNVLCNGAHAPLIDFERVLTDNCLSGSGLKVSLGLDADQNNALAPYEVTKESFLCDGNKGIDGVNGYSSLVRSERLALDECRAGMGLRVDTGIDFNRDMMLQDEEVMAQEILCDGVNGKSSLVTASKTSTSPQVCASEKGVLIQTGLDDNDNGLLDIAEIDNQALICEGASTHEDPTDPQDPEEPECEEDKWVNDWLK